MSFISAVRTYAELSGLNGTASGVGEAFSPLVGVWAPTFSACELAAAFLLPFVAIRLVGGDRQSGALTLELQHPMSPLARMSAKALVLLAGWLVASAPPLIAVLMWKAYGGTLYLPELATVAFGHVLNAGLTIALAAATAAVTEHPSTAAIVTLGVTVGTWIINFVAAIHGGVWQTLAGYTPTAMVAEFQHGLVRLDVVLIAMALIAAGLVAGRHLDADRRVRPATRCPNRCALAAATAAVAFSCAFVTASWDTSESRANSFSGAGRRGTAGDSPAAPHRSAPGAPRTRARSISSIARSRNSGGRCPACRSNTCRQHPRDSSSRPRLTTARSGTSSADGAR